jgi:hypothetical protein
MPSVKSKIHEMTQTVFTFIIQQKTTQKNSAEALLFDFSLTD